MSEPLKAKGTSVSSTVAGLKASSRFRSFVPQRLQHYLDKPIFVSNWYPIEDYFDLLRALAKTADPKITHGDPFFFFGRVAAQRDLKSNQDLVPAKQRMRQVGLYRRSLASSEDPAPLGERIRRVLNARRYYYSSGSYNVRRTGERTIRIRLDDFPFISADACTMATGYWTETFGGDGFAGTLRKVTCRAAGQAECVWEITFGPEIDVSDLAQFESEEGVNP